VEVFLAHIRAHSCCRSVTRWDGRASTPCSARRCGIRGSVGPEFPGSVATQSPVSLPEDYPDPRLARPVSAPFHFSDRLALSAWGPAEPYLIDEFRHLLRLDMQVAPRDDRLCFEKPNARSLRRGEPTGQKEAPLWRHWGFEEGRSRLGGRIVLQRVYRPFVTLI